MLYDPKKWAMPEVKPEAPQLEPWQKILLDAAEILEKNGWCRGHYVAPDGRHCAVGALNIAAGVLVGYSPPVKLDVNGSRRMAMEKLMHQVKCNCVENWNDGYAKSGKAVITAFRAAAKS